MRLMNVFADYRVRAFAIAKRNLFFRNYPWLRDHIHSEANDAICLTTYATTITSKIQTKMARTFIRSPSQQDECQRF